MTPKTIAIGAVLALVLVSAGGSAQAAPTWADGNDVKAYCRSGSPSDQGVCLGFAIAVAGIVANEPVAGWRACVPRGVNGRQLVDIMVKFLDDHPEGLHANAVTLVATAFATAFPCSN